jgi:hypothetical protein
MPDLAMAARGKGSCRHHMERLVPVSEELQVERFVRDEDSPSLRNGRPKLLRSATLGQMLCALYLNPGTI